MGARMKGLKGWQQVCKQTLNSVGLTGWEIICAKSQYFKGFSPKKYRYGIGTIERLQNIILSAEEAQIESWERNQQYFPRKVQERNAAVYHGGRQW